MTSLLDRLPPEERATWLAWCEATTEPAPPAAAAARPMSESEFKAAVAAEQPPKEAN